MIHNNLSTPYHVAPGVAWAASGSRMACNALPGDFEDSGVLNSSSFSRKIPWSLATLRIAAPISQGRFLTGEIMGSVLGAKVSTLFVRSYDDKNPKIFVWPCSWGGNIIPWYLYGLFPWFSLFFTFNCYLANTPVQKKNVSYTTPRLRV